MNPPQQRKSKPLSELKEKDMGLSDLRKPAVFLFSGSRWFESKPCLVKICHSTCLLFPEAQTNIYDTKSDLPLFLFLLLLSSRDDNVGVFVDISLRMNMFWICADKSLLKFYDQTLFCTFYSFSWIPTALRKCLHLPFHLCIVIIFHFKTTREGRRPLKRNPGGEEMWNNAVEPVKEMRLNSSLTCVTVTDWCSSEFPLQQNAELPVWNVSSTKPCCCCWRTQTLMPTITGIGHGF